MLDSELFAKYLPYFNLQEGLGRLGGNKNLYLKLLKMFTSVVDLHAIKVKLDSGAYEEARSIVHTIKGTSANLSIQALYEASIQFEATIKCQQSCADEYEKYRILAEKTLEMLPQLISDLAM